MQQVLQELNHGRTVVENIPSPSVKPGCLLIASQASLLSAGTERSLVDFGKANLIDKARQQPDKVRQVLEKVKTDGLLTTVDAVRSQLDYPISMGYCNAGIVVDVGEGVQGFQIGDRVASNGKHAEIVSVPQNLCAKIPRGVADEQAAFTVLGAIALQGIRLAAPTLGETVAVMGLGLVGLLTIQLLRSNGCRVLGIDMDAQRLELAKQFGARTVDMARGEDPLAAADDLSRGRGVDAVLITASTKSNQPVHQAAQMSRKRGRIVLVGVVGLELSRSDFYEKELTFQVSCSYGPGRYDPGYEEQGSDYPVGFVRWTEQRNFEAVLDLLAQQQLDIEPLITHRFKIDDAPAAYDLLTRPEPSLGIVFHYPRHYPEVANDRLYPIRHDLSDTPSPSVDQPVIGFIGAGQFARRVLIPAFAKAGAGLHTVVSAEGVSAVHAAKAFSIAHSTTDVKAVLEQSAINTVVITTRHNSHAEFVCEALSHGKHVFVEKPLCLTASELSCIETAYEKARQTHDHPLHLMVGFNRRFAPHIVQLQHLLDSLTEPKVFIMTVNAGAIPAGHWTQDHSVGGGRILGEACHFIDLLRCLARAPIVHVDGVKIAHGRSGAVGEDKASIMLRFADGSHGTIHYLGNGHRAFPKERLEVFCAGRIAQLDNFRQLRTHGWSRVSKMKRWRQDKGHSACAQAFVDAVRHGTASPISPEELFEVTRATLNIANRLAD